MPSKTNNNIILGVVGVFLLVLLVISILSLVYACQVNNSLNDTNNDIDDIDASISAISYTDPNTTISSNLIVDGSMTAKNITTPGHVTANGMRLDTQINSIIDQLTTLQTKIQPYIANQTSTQLTILTPTYFDELMSGNIVIEGTVMFNGVDVTDNLKDLQAAWSNAVSTGILNVNKSINTPTLNTNNFTCTNFYGGVKAYITCIPSSSTTIKLNSGCTFVYVSAGTYTITVNSSITGIMGLPICTSDQYTTYVSQTSTYVYTVYCKGGGSSPDLKDPGFLCFMLM